MSVDKKFEDEIENNAMDIRRLLNKNVKLIILDETNSCATCLTHKIAVSNVK